MIAIPFTITRIRHLFSAVTRRLRRSREIAGQLRALIQDAGPRGAGLAVASHVARRLGLTTSDRGKANRFVVGPKGVDPTAGVIEVDELDMPESTRAHAVRYEASAPFELRFLLSRLDVDLSTYTFLDYGSGKGRALLIAADLPFRSVVGVEASPSLHATAERAIGELPADRRAGGRVRSVLADAAEFAPPPGPLVAYMYNPFGPPVLEPVLDRLLARESGPGQSYLVYNNAVHHELMVRWGLGEGARGHFGGRARIYRLPAG